MRKRPFNPDIIPLDADGISADALADAPSTDDTPTIISRNTSSQTGITGDEPSSIRGRRLAHFELIEPIGVGGMAAVLRARDTQLDRFVALKILPPEMSVDEENIRRFHQEARSAAKLDHENIARVFFCGEDQRLHFIAFEFVEGNNLRSILERQGRLPVGEAIHYMLQVAAGLSHASRRGVVHRDIKPSNIIITPTGRAKLVDMGLARSLEPRTDNDLTQSGVTLGTFDYISPEQALEPRDADVRSDIYSLGCTFYHVLTGRPPVPEGTAAKKLHHHQHVKPPDPRQFVSDLPVEIVQILDRMMAKNPRQRFQTPEHLIHQLLLVAQKFGSSPDVPEGVLSVEAPVMGHPTSRPLLWAALAAVLVITLVFLLDQTPSKPGQAGIFPTTRPEKQDDQKEGKGSGVVLKPQENLTPGSTPTTVKLASYVPEGKETLKDLLAWLDKNREAPRIELILNNDLHLSSPDLGSVGLVISARQEVTIRSRNPQEPVTLHFHYDSNWIAEKLVALTIQSPKIQLEGIRFLVDAHEGNVDLTSLLLSPGKHRIERCEFIQAQPLLKSTRRFASVVADAAGMRSDVIFRDCVFLGFRKHETPTEIEDAGMPVLTGVEGGGQDAVVRRGSARVLAENCVFGPHTNTFRLEMNAPEETGLVTLKHCTVLLPARGGTAFNFPLGAAGRIKADSNLFARWSGEGSEVGAVLLQQAGSDRSMISYQGQDNCYYDLDGYWSVNNDWKKAGWREFRKKLDAISTKDESPRVLTMNPWQLTDAAEQSAEIEKAQASRASDRYSRPLAVNLRLAALRQSTSEIIGADSFLGERWVPTTLPKLPEKDELTLKSVLVVEENNNDSSNGFYQSLDVAVRSARAGDTILIRHNGLMKIDPVVLNKVGLRDLTIRPARQFHPVLMLGEEVSDAEPALFKVHDGQLRLEGLEFQLNAGKKPFRSQTVIAMVGDCECIMRDCVITLIRSGDIPLSVASLAEIGKVMKLDMQAARTREQGPRLAMERCFTRGEGDLLACRANRPFALELKESLVALSGSIYSLDASPENQMPPAGQLMKILLDQTTTYLGSPLVRLNIGNDVSGLVPLRFKVTNSLLIPASPSKPMIQLEGSDSDDRFLKDRFRWERGQNAYGYTNFFVHEKGEGMPAGMGLEKWKSTTNEDTSQYGIKLEDPPGGAVRFSRIKADHLRTPANALLRSIGVPQTRLPIPAP